MKAIILISLFFISFGAMAQKEVKDTTFTENTPFVTLKHLNLLDQKLQEIIPKKWYDLVFAELQKMAVEADNERKKKNK